MKRKFFVITTLTIILFIQAAGLLQGQGNEHPTCALEGDAGEVLESVGDAVMSLEGFNVPKPVVDKLWSAFNAVESCNNAFDCVNGIASFCVAPLQKATAETPTDDFSADATNQIAFVQRGLNFVVAFDAENWATTYIPVIPTVPAPNNCTAKIEYLPRSSNIPSRLPTAVSGAGTQRCIETNLPEGTYMWTVEGRGYSTGGRVPSITGSNMEKIVTISLPVCENECEVTVTVIKTVDGEPCSDFHQFNHFSGRFSQPSF